MDRCVERDLKIAAARFGQARAALRGARSALYPQVTASPSIARVSPSGNRPTTAASDSYTDFIIPFDATYEADVWGRVRSSVDASHAAAQASVADLEAVRLSLHGELAADYFMLCGLDREARLLAEAATGDERALELTRNRFRGGIVSQADVDQAETELESTRAQMVDVQVNRALFEHAIAVLVGTTPSSFTVARAPLDAEPPPIPVGIPSELLERRPDIAGAERRMAQAGAEVGVTQAAFYPVLTLSGSFGFEAATFGRWLVGASNFWSVAPALLVPLFDAGRRKADFEQAKAVYVETEASYRLSVLERSMRWRINARCAFSNRRAIQARATAAAERCRPRPTTAIRRRRHLPEVITAQSRALEPAG